MKVSYSSAKSMLQLAAQVSIILLDFSRQQLVSSVQQLVSQLQCSYSTACVRYMLYLGGTVLASAPCMLSDICLLSWQLLFMHVSIASYPGPEMGLVSTDSRMCQFYAGILTEMDMMMYKLGGEYRLYVICALSLSAVYICKISENWQSSQLALERSVQQVSLKRTKASSTKVVSPETSRCRPPSKLPRK